MNYTNNDFQVGMRVIVNITDTYKPTATILYMQKNVCFVKIDKSHCNTICRYSELTPVNE